MAKEFNPDGSPRLDNYATEPKLVDVNSVWFNEDGTAKDIQSYVKLDPNKRLIAISPNWETVMLQNEDGFSFSSYTRQDVVNSYIARFAKQHIGESADTILDSLPKEIVFDGCTYYLAIDYVAYPDEQCIVSYKSSITYLGSTSVHTGHTLKEALLYLQHRLKQTHPELLKPL